MLYLRYANFGLALLSVAVLNQFEMRVAAAQDTVQVQIVADEMCCKGCAQKIAAQLYAAPGVISVEADVPNRLMTITVKPSSSFSLGRLWQAVDQGKGQPSKLITTDTTYVLTRPQNVQPGQRLHEGEYLIDLRSLNDSNVAQRIADQLYGIGGVQSVQADVSQRRMHVQSANGTALSPWSLAAAAERANTEPIAVGGPYGWLTIEHKAAANSAAVHPYQTQQQGVVR